MNETTTTKPDRAATARAARSRQAEERWAQRLRERGWLAVPPDGVMDLPEVLTWEQRTVVRMALRGAWPRVRYT